MGLFDFLKKKQSPNQPLEQKSVNLQPQHIALGMLDAYDLNDKRLDSILKAVTPLFYINLRLDILEMLMSQR